MKMTNDEYKKYADRHSPRSKAGGNMLRAFLVGGLICCIGQLIGDLYQMAGLETEAASTATSVTLVFLGAMLTGFGIYDSVARIAGVGTLVS